VLKRQAAQAGDGDNSPKPITDKRARLATGVGPMSKYLCHKNEHTLQAVIARMTAREGLPFRVFVTSSDLCKALAALGFGNIPASANGVRFMVMEQG